MSDRETAFLRRDGGVALITLDNPPVNALDAAMRGKISALMSEAIDDAQIKLIALTAEGPMFSAGADIRELDGAPEGFDLSELCLKIEQSPKPVIAIIRGAAIGGGMELALAAHYRVASKRARFAIPEITLGMIPGGGATQRLPRLAGAAFALDLIMRGQAVSAQACVAAGIVDLIDDGAPEDIAQTFLEEELPPRRCADMRAKLDEGPAFMKAVAKARTKAGDAPALSAIVDCIEAALLLPFEAGLAREKEAFVECLTSEDSVGLRYAFLAERRVVEFRELGASARTLSQVAIVGGGALGVETALACLDGGFSTVLVSLDADRARRDLERVNAYMQRHVQRGIIDETQSKAMLDNLVITSQINAIGSAGLVIEASSDDPKKKAESLKAIAQHALPDAVIACQTAFLDIAPLAKAIGRVENFVGLHLFWPILNKRLVEVIVPPEASAEAVVTLHHFVRRLGKLPVRVSSSEGLIADRLVSRLRYLSDVMVEDGALPQQIDWAFRALGFAQGPYQLIDAVGLDQVVARRKLLHTQPGKRDVSEIVGLVSKAGFLGQKLRRGFYVYSDGRQIGVQNPEAIALIEKLRARKGITPREFPAEEIQQRLLLGLINEAAALLGEGIAARPSDIDVVMVHGLAYPRSRGGLMLKADRRGPVNIAERIAKYVEAQPDVWTMAPLLAELARERGRFSDLRSAQ